MLNCVYIPSYLSVCYFVEYNIGRMFCVKLRLIVIEDSCCKQVSLPRFVSGQGQTVLRFKGHRETSSGIDLLNSVVPAGKKTRVQNSIVSVTSTPKATWFLLIGGTNPEKNHRRLHPTGHWRYYSSPQRYQGQDRRTLVMLIQPNRSSSPTIRTIVVALFL